MFIVDMLIHEALRHNHKIQYMIIGRHLWRAMIESVYFRFLNKNTTIPLYGYDGIYRGHYIRVNKDSPYLIELVIEKEIP